MRTNEKIFPFAFNYFLSPKAIAEKFRNKQELMTFVLISQNRLSEESEYRTNLNLQIALLTEHEVTRVLQMLDAIQDKMGIDNDEDSELADLEMETKPEDVLTEIERLQQLALKRKQRHRSKEEMGNTIIPLGKRFLLEAQLGILLATRTALCLF